jgi:hypothetical protein
MNKVIIADPFTNNKNIITLKNDLYDMFAEINGNITSVKIAKHNTESVVTNFPEYFGNFNSASGTLTISRVPIDITCYKDGVDINGYYVINVADDKVNGFLCNNYTIDGFLYSVFSQNTNYDIYVHRDKDQIDGVFIKLI